MAPGATLRLSDGARKFLAGHLKPGQEEKLGEMLSRIDPGGKRLVDLEVCVHAFADWGVGR